MKRVYHMATWDDAAQEVQRFHDDIEAAKARADLSPQAQPIIAAIEDMCMDLETAVATHTNGTHTKGRAVPPLPLHTFQDSGITVGLRKIAPNTQAQLSLQIQREIPRPQPPVNQTELGPEKNEADPDYARQLEEWERACSMRLNRIMFTIAALECECGVDMEEVERKQRSFRAAKFQWEEDPDLSDAERAKVFYIEHIACATQEDMREFYAAVTRRSQPTEAAVRAHIDSFRGDVPGA